MPAERITIPTLELQLTNTCQHSCTFCANTDGPENQQAVSREMLTSIFGKADIGTVIFTGGEPTTRMPLLLDGIRAAKESGVSIIKMNSNMELLTPERLKLLEKAGLDTLHFSLNTLDPERHRQLRGNPRASVEQVVKTIQAALETTQLNLKPEFVGTRENLKDFWAIYSHLDKLHQAYPNRIGTLELQRMIQTGRAENSSPPSIDEIIETLRQQQLGELGIDAFCFGKEGAKLAQHGINPLKCLDHSECGCSLVRMDVRGRISDTNFAGSSPIGDITTLTPRAVTNLLSTPCPLAAI